MKTYIKKIILISFAAAFLPFSLVSADSSHYNGEIIGLNCLKGTMDCSSDMYKYAHIAYEPDFVLKISSQKHYMLPNVPRAVKQSLSGKKVIITGELIRKNTSINATKIELKTGDSQILVWPIERKDDWIKKWRKEKDMFGN